MNPIHAHVTATDDSGHARFMSSGPVEPIEVRFQPGTQFFRVWATDDSGALAGPPVAASFAPFFPTDRGTRCLVIRIPPGSEQDGGFEMGGSAMDHDALREDAEAKLPGLFGVHETDEDAAFHATETVDYVFILEGELYLELDGGDEVRLEQGHCVVQRGTKHKWSNRSGEPAAFAVVLVAAALGS